MCTSWWWYARCALYIGKWLCWSRFPFPYYTLRYYIFKTRITNLSHRNDVNYLWNTAIVPLKNGLVSSSDVWWSERWTVPSDEYRENKFRHLCIIRMGHCVPSVHIFEVYCNTIEMSLWSCVFFFQRINRQITACVFPVNFPSDRFSRLRRVICCCLPVTITIIAPARESDRLAERNRSRNYRGVKQE